MSEINRWPEERYTLREILFFLVIILLASSLRFPMLDRDDLFFDEAQSIQLAARDSLDIIFDILTGERQTHPPLYHIILSYWLEPVYRRDRITPREIAARGRLLSAYADIVTLIAVYLIARTLTGKKIAIIASLLHAVAPQSVFFARYVRSYSFATMAVFISILFYVLWLRDGKKRYLFMATLSGASSLYIHYFSFFLPLACLLHALFHERMNRDGKKTIIYFLFLSMLLVPIITVHACSLYLGEWWKRVMLSFNFPVKSFFPAATGMLLDLFWGFRDELPFARSIPVEFLLGTITFIFLIVLIRNTDKNIALLRYLIFFPVICILFMAFIMQFFSISLLHVKYIVFVLPALCTGAAYMLDRFSRMKKLFFAALFILLLIFSVAEERWGNTSFEELMRNLSTNIEDGDAVLIVPYWLKDFYSIYSILESPPPAENSLASFLYPVVLEPNNFSNMAGRATGALEILVEQFLENRLDGKNRVWLVRDRFAHEPDCFRGTLISFPLHYLKEHYEKKRQWQYYNRGGITLELWARGNSKFSGENTEKQFVAEERTCIPGKTDRTFEVLLVAEREEGPLSFSTELFENLFARVKLDGRDSGKEMEFRPVNGKMRGELSMEVLDSNEISLSLFSGPKGFAGNLFYLLLRPLKFLLYFSESSGWVAGSRGESFAITGLDARCGGKILMRRGILSDPLVNLVIFIFSLFCTLITVYSGICSVRAGSSSGKMHINSADTLYQCSGGASR